MAALPTSSFRAPAEFHPLVHSVAKALTRRPDLAEPLRVLLATVADTAAPAEPLPSLADLVRRLDAVERQVAEHGALLAVQPALPAPAVRAEGSAMPALPTVLHAPHGEPWTVGEGKQRRLTAAGLAELDRRLDAGELVAAIAEALGVSVMTVRRRRDGGAERATDDR